MLLFSLLYVHVYTCIHTYMQKRAVPSSKTTSKAAVSERQAAARERRSAMRNRLREMKIAAARRAQEEGGEREMEGRVSEKHDVRVHVTVKFIPLAELESTRTGVHVTVHVCTCTCTKHPQ